jgi:hypothetical protein
MHNNVYKAVSVLDRGPNAVAILLSVQGFMFRMHSENCVGIHDTGKKLGKKMETWRN